MKPPDGGLERIHLGVVHGPGEVYMVAVGRSHQAMMCRLAEGLREDVHLQLWEEDAIRFLQLLEEGDPEAAVALYFARVGERWDPARLRVEAVPMA